MSGRSAALPPPPGRGGGSLGVVVPAAGSGTRMGGTAKPFIEVGGHPVLWHALKAFLDHPATCAVVVALPAPLALQPPSWLTELDRRVSWVAGGDTRLASVRAALGMLPACATIVAVHDGARPVVQRDWLDRCLDLAAGGVGAVVGVPAVDTIKRVDDQGRVVETPDRAHLWQVQTPQVFPRDLLQRAYDAAGAEPATDDAQLVERVGGEVRVVDGSTRNLKITHPWDPEIAEVLLRKGAHAERAVRAAGDAGTAAAHVKGGGILAYPTETVYGLGCLPQPGPLGQLARLKGRGGDQRFLLLIRDAADLPGLTWGSAARSLAERFWPGPLTLVLPDPEATVPAALRNDQGGVAVRVSSHPTVRALLKALGGPLISTSTNRSGEAPAVSAEGVRTFLAQAGDFDVQLLDGGELPPSLPSTMVVCDGESAVLVRRGAIDDQVLKSAFPGLEVP